MTDEQIKQNAEEYAKKHETIINYYHDEPETDFEDKKNTYIAGAHSRDEEIKELKRKNVEYFQSMEYWQKRARRLYIRRTKQGEQMKELRDELNKLHNPWISVDDEETKPAVGQQILIEYPNGEHGLAHFVVNYQGISTFETFEVIRWMSIPY